MRFLSLIAAASLAGLSLAKDKAGSIKLIIE